MTVYSLIESRNTYTAKFKLDCRYDRVSSSNYSFFYQYKVFERLRIAVTSICVDIVYITKLRRFRFLNVIDTTLTKIEVITILPTSIKNFLEKDIRTNAFFKYKICAMQLSDLNYRDKKTTRYIDMFQIGCNFCKV